MARNDTFADADFDADLDTTEIDAAAAESDAAAEAAVNSTSDADASADTTDAEAEAAAALEAHQATVQAFADAADRAVESADESTGTVPDAELEAALKAYREITGGIKFKNLGKAHVTDSMKDALNTGDVSQFAVARAYNEINEGIMSAAKSAPKAERAPKVVVSPAQVHADKVSAQRIALTLVEDDAPADAEGWEQHVLSESAEEETIAAVRAHLAWSDADEDERGDEPVLSPIARAALKIAQGKSPSKVKSSGGGSSYTGPRRSVEAHILNAFADQPSGTFLTVAEIRAVKSDEYGDEAPSAGAISARLFPKSGKVSISGVIPGENDKGVNGATKA